MEEIRKVCSSLEWMLASSACGTEQIWELLETKAKQGQGVQNPRRAALGCNFQSTRSTMRHTNFAPQLRAGNSRTKNKAARSFRSQFLPLWWRSVFLVALSREDLQILIKCLDA